ncbi:MAG: phosphoenolpyruvate synthase [Candidatus Thermoplasmatota archaeon]|nr:phosphoenolpyruvate synthase [Candidatus Thermoplasmatota archaeon]
MKGGYILWFDEIDSDDISLVGGKNASLGEMYGKLSKDGIKIPNGFAVTSIAYKKFMEDSGVSGEIKKLLDSMDTKDVKDLKKKGERIRNLIKNSPMPKDLEKEIVRAYKKMEEMYGGNVDVAIRSSATAEDLPTASFAGQQDTYLNVKGKENVIESIINCFASLFTDRAISYREDHGFRHLDVYISVGVQKMVHSDLACSGVMFSIDTESGFENAVYITGVWGLGETIVQGEVNPDQFYVFKSTLRKVFRPIVEKKLGDKRKMLVCSENGTVERTVSEKKRNEFVLSDDEILLLAKWACRIEEHYGMPMDMEWAKDGKSNEIFIVQARPETVHSAKKVDMLCTYRLLEKGNAIAKGEAIGSKIGQGKARVIKNASEIEKFRNGEVLVTGMTDPDWEPIMKIASAIVTDRGGRTCHAAIVSRELGIPAVVGTNDATCKIKDGMPITADCSGGVGNIYEGLLKYKVEEIPLDSIPNTKTKIMMNAAIPEKAFLQCQIPNDGVGLAREEFVISSHIGIHPMALIEYDKLKKIADKDKKIMEIVREIDNRTLSYKNKVEFFVEQLAMGIGKIAAGFYPNDVIVRLSDFKTNEYASLIGGYLYEPAESNPMLGWRGASRYYDKKFKPAFELECRAIKKVRDEMGLSNVKVMVPFCRTPDEGKKVIKTMEEFGLKQGENGLEIYVMCEIPSNVILADKFADIFDGFSIGSNDLTQLLLGLDRDSDIVANLFDERNEAVKRMVKEVIKIAKEHGKKIGICGQAPSDFPEFAEFLVECGIDSISLNPDTVIETRLMIAEKERKLGIK